MLLRRAAPRLVARSGRQHCRSFWGGAFETDFDEMQAKARRSRLRSFLGALDQLHGTAADAESSDVVTKSLTEHATSDAFDTKEQLAAAVGSARESLEALQTPSLLKLVLAPKPDADAATAGSAGGDPAAAALAATQPGRLAPVDDEESDAPPDELSEEQLATLVSMRHAAAVGGLPQVWERLLMPPAADVMRSGGVSLATARDTAEALASSDPWGRLRCHLDLAHGTPPLADGGGARSPTIAELRAAAAATAEAAFPQTRAMLLASNQLSEAEIERLDSLGDKAAATLTAEVRRRSLFQRLWHRLAPGAAAAGEGGAPPTAEAMAEADRADAALFAAMGGEAKLHTSLAKALWSYHDRLSTRRRRRVNAAKGTATFFALMIADFVVSNL